MKQRGPQQSLHRALDIIGFVLLVTATFATLSHLWDNLGYYDEGLLLTDAQLILRGAAPHRRSYQPVRERHGRHGGLADKAQVDRRAAA